MPDKSEHVKDAFISLHSSDQNCISSHARISKDESFNCNKVLTVFSVCGDSLVVIFQRKFIALVEPNNSLKIK